jgi:large subunit ribosomal protein L32e
MRKKFRRQEWFRFRRLGEKWRKPRGKDSKLRLGKKGKPVIPSTGFRTPKNLRGLHPSGLREVLIHNSKELNDLVPQKHVVRIGAGVGGRQREKILARAEEIKIKVVNPGGKKHAAKSQEKISS